MDDDLLSLLDLSNIHLVNGSLHLQVGQIGQDDHGGGCGYRLSNVGSDGDDGARSGGDESGITELPPGLLHSDLGLVHLSLTDGQFLRGGAVSKPVHLSLCPGDLRCRAFQLRAGGTSTKSLQLSAGLSDLSLGCSQLIAGWTGHCQIIAGQSLLVINGGLV